PLGVAVRLRNQVGPPPEGLEHLEMHCVLSILQDKVVVVDDVVNKLIGHHRQRASAKDKRPAGLYQTPSMPHKHKRKDHYEDVNQIRLTHHPRARSNPRQEVVPSIVLLFGALVQIEREQSEARCKHIVAGKPASRKKNRIGNDQKNRHNRGAPTKVASGNQVSQKKHQRGGYQVEGASLRQPPPEKFQEPSQGCEEDRRKRVPDILNVAAQVLVHRERELAASQQLVGHLKSHGLVTVRHWNVGQSLGSAVHKGAGD